MPTTTAGLLQKLRASSIKEQTSSIAVENESAVSAMLEAAATTQNVANQLMLVIDYDLTISAAATAECHHMLRDASSVPEGFRSDVRILFDARDPSHAQHEAIYGSESDANRPHRFWLHYNMLLVQHGITHAMIEAAVAEEGRRRNGRLLRDHVGDLLSLCEAAGVLVVILSAGLEQVITAAFQHDGVRLPAAVRLLSNSLVFDDASDGGGCVRVDPQNPPASREGKLRLLASLRSETSDRSLVLLVGDKPVDARVGRGLPPPEDGHPPRTELSFGFFNECAVDSMVPANLGDWQHAFHLLAHRGSECTFAPVSALVRQLLKAPDDKDLGCDGDSCAIEWQANNYGGHATKPEADDRTDNVVVMYSRPVCTLCWMCKFQFWWAGLTYEVRSFDDRANVRDWSTALDRNGFPGGSFTLPVVVHGEKAWWSTPSFSALVKELKTRMGVEMQR